MAAALLKDTLLQSMMTEQQLYRLVPQNVADLVVKVGRLDDICHVRPLCPCFKHLMHCTYFPPMQGPVGIDTILPHCKFCHLTIITTQYKGSC